MLPSVFSRSLSVELAIELCEQIPSKSAYKTSWECDPGGARGAMSGQASGWSAGSATCIFIKVAPSSFVN